MGDETERRRRASPIEFDDEKFYPRVETRNCLRESIHQ